MIRKIKLIPKTDYGRKFIKIHGNILPVIREEDSYLMVDLKQNRKATILKIIDSNFVIEDEI